MHQGFKKFDSFISKHNKFILSTHESPDWDGLGAEIGLFELLKNLGKSPLILNSDKTPSIVRFIDLEGDIKVIDSYDIPDDISEYVQFVLDTNDYNNIGKIYTLINDKIKDVFIIDHHEGTDDKYKKNFIKSDASSTCEIIYEIADYYKKPISLKAAQALYAGMLYDTGSFRYPKTSPETFRIAASLVEHGVTPFFVYEQIYEQNSLEGFRLNGKILSTMEVLHNGKLIAMKLTKEMLISTGSTFTEGELAINYPLTVRGVIASLLIKQDITGPVKVSMRTKGNYNVAKIAMENNGGGHKNAAGYKSKLSVNETYKIALENMNKLFTGKKYR